MALIIYPSGKSYIFNQIKTLHTQKVETNKELDTCFAILDLCLIRLHSVLGKLRDTLKEKK